MLTLTAMTTEVFQHYLKNAITDYASDKVKNGTWSKNDAHELAVQSYNHFSPKGIDTPNHYLYSIYLRLAIPGFSLIQQKK